MAKRPCLVCGVLASTSYCEAHAPAVRGRDRRSRPDRRQRRRGYDAAWQRLSKRARRLQPFCSDCGATSDLQADHSVEAWRRKSEGLPIRLADVDVVCGPCNRRRGDARDGQRQAADDARARRRPTLGDSPSVGGEHPGGL